MTEKKIRLAQNVTDVSSFCSEGCVVDIKQFLAPLPARLALEGIYLDLAIEYFSFLFYH